MTILMDIIVYFPVNPVNNISRIIVFNIEEDDEIRKQLKENNYPTNIINFHFVCFIVMDPLVAWNTFEDFAPKQEI